jgi:hypothetical protein
MLEVNIDGNLFSIKQSPKDFTIGEYEDIVSIIKNDEFDEFDRYYELFLHLGIPQDLLDDFDIFNFKKLISAYNDLKEENTMINEIEIDGVKYKSYDKEFSISLKQMRTSIDCIKNDNVRCLAEIMAIFFHEVGVSRDDNWNRLDDRSDLFREKMTADVANPYFLEIIKKLYNEHTKELE